MPQKHLPFLRTDARQFLQSALQVGHRSQFAMIRHAEAVRLIADARQDEQRRVALVEDDGQFAIWQEHALFRAKLQPHAFLASHKSRFCEAAHGHPAE